MTPKAIAERPWLARGATLTGIVLVVFGVGITLLAHRAVREQQAAVDGLRAHLDSLVAEWQRVPTRTDTVVVKQEIAQREPYVSSAESHLAQSIAIRSLLWRWNGPGLLSVVLGLGFVVTSSIVTRRGRKRSSAPG